MPMHNISPPTHLHQSGSFPLAFLSSTVSLVAPFAAAAVPIPVYNIYRSEDGFYNLVISMAIVTYSVGAGTGLLVLGRLSNHLGRRVTAIISLGLLLLGCVLNVHVIGTLLAGRVLMGVGTGLASSPWPRDLIYLLCIAVLFLSASLIAFSLETANPTPGAWRSMLPRISVPARVRPLLPVASLVFLATWATGAFYQAFVPSLVEQQLHTRSPLILGLVFAAYMAPSVLGAPIGGRFASAMAQRVGMITFLSGIIGIIVAIHTAALELFIFATVIAGAGQGIAISATTRGLLDGSTLAEWAPIFAVIYLLCYSGATVPSLISGELSNTFSLPQITVGYLLLAVLAALFTVLGARNPHACATGSTNIDTLGREGADSRPALLSSTARSAHEGDAT